MERFFLELDPPDQAMLNWPHVVVVGGGFAGLKICHCLARQPVRVTLIDKRNFNLCQPLLYPVASGLVTEADIASPLRQMGGDAPNIQILLGEVVDIDPEARQVVFNGQHYGYDQLILATGSGSTYFGREEWRSLAPPMKILEHADEIRRRLLMALEEAEQTTDPKQRAFLQTVVVVGAGPAGCELAGSLIELIHRAVQRNFKQLRQDDCRVVLVDLVDRVLPTMAVALSDAAATYLQGAGVELQLGHKVDSIGPGRVCLVGSAGTQQLEVATICWTAGVRASRLGGLLCERTGCAVDRGGRLVVNPDFSIPNYPDIRTGRPRHPGPPPRLDHCPLPLAGPRHHGGDRSLVCRGRPVGCAPHRSGWLGGVGPGPFGLHSRH